MSEQQSKITLVQKKIINSLLYGKYEVMNISFARIHTSEIKSKEWLYSGLEGALVYCLKADSKPNTCRFLMFDLKSFEIVFDCELYKKFEKAYKKGTERFYYFEISNGFIGFEIPDMSEAQILCAQVMNFKDEYIKTKVKEYKTLQAKELQEKSKRMLDKLDNRFKMEKVQNKLLRPEITLTNGRLEREINTVLLDDETGKLTIKGSGHQGVEKDILKVRGLDLVFKNDIKVGHSETFTKYISTNFLRSFMKGLIIPKRKINRGEGIKVDKLDNNAFEPVQNQEENKEQNNEEENQQKEEQNEIKLKKRKMKL